MDVKGTLKAVMVSAAVLFPVVASATDKANKPPPPSASAGTQVTIVGENYCLGCALKKEHGAAAQCSKYGHRHSLRVERAVDAGGKEMADLKGRTLSYLDNDKSEKLFKGEEFHKQRVEVKGRLFPQESVIDVQEYKVP